MINKTLLLLLVIAVFAGCGNNEKAQEKALLDSVEAVHDKVMGDDDAIMKAKSQLKALSASKPALKDSIDYYSKQLDANDNQMMDWMNKFNPEFTGKSHEVIMNYLKAQEKQVIAIDSQLKESTHQAVDFYNRNNKK